MPDVINAPPSAGSPSKGPSPMLDALAAFRGGSDAAQRTPAGGTAAGGAEEDPNAFDLPGEGGKSASGAAADRAAHREAGDQPPDDEGDDQGGKGEEELAGKTGEEEQEETPGGGEAAAAKGEGEEAGEAGKEGAPAEELFEVLIPGPNAAGAKGPHGTGAIVLEGVPKEAHDSIRYHIKRSERVDALEARIQGLEPYEEAAGLIEQHPTAALHLIDDQFPDAVQPFVQDWVKMNPEAALRMMEELDLESLPERHRKLEAENARGKREKLLKEAIGKNAVSTTATRFVARAGTIVKQYIDSAGLTGEDADAFAAAAANRLKTAYNTRQSQGQGPMSEADMVEALQPVLKRFLGLAADTKPARKAASDANGKGTKPAADQAAEAARRMALKAKTAEDQRKLQGGKRGVKPTGSRKVKPGTDLAGAIAALREGKLGG